MRSLFIIYELKNEGTAVMEKRQLVLFVDWYFNFEEHASFHPISERLVLLTNHIEISVEIILWEFGMFTQIEITV